MRPNVKVLLKTKTPLFNFKYDEDKYNTSGVFDYGAVLMKEMNDEEIIDKLVEIGLNFGFSPKVISLIKSAVEVRRRLWDKRIPQESGVGKKLRRELDSVKRGLSEVKTEIQGVREALITYINAGLGFAKSLSDKDGMYAYPDLVEVATKAVKLFESLKKQVDLAVSITSAEAYKTALLIIDAIDEWATGSMLDAVEDGSIINKELVNAPLEDAVKLAKKWASEMPEVQATVTPVSGQTDLPVYSDTTDQLAQLL